jgi:hypothetical protein
MPLAKLEIRHFRDKNDDVFVFYRYWDDGTKRYEYQVYKLVSASEVVREFGIDQNESENARAICDKLFEQETAFHKIIPKQGRKKNGY